jgi:hypothetical protein
MGALRPSLIILIQLLALKSGIAGLVSKYDVGDEVADSLAGWEYPVGIGGNHTISIVAPLRIDPSARISTIILE